MPPAPNPSISVPSGTYTAPLSVVITNSNLTPNIYYTLDGSTPTPTNSGLWFGIGPLLINRSCTLKTYATGNGFTDSGVVSATYTINSDTSRYPTITSQFSDNFLRPDENPLNPTTWQNLQGLTDYDNSALPYFEGPAAVVSHAAVPTAGFDAWLYKPKGITYPSNQYIELFFSVGASFSVDNYVWMRTDSTLDFSMMFWISGLGNGPTSTMMGGLQLILQFWNSSGSLAANNPIQLLQGLFIQAVPGDRMTFAYIGNELSVYVNKIRCYALMQPTSANNGMAVLLKTPLASFDSGSAVMPPPPPPQAGGQMSIGQSGIDLSGSLSLGFLRRIKE